MRITDQVEAKTKRGLDPLSSLGFDPPYGRGQLSDACERHRRRATEARESIAIEKPRLRTLTEGKDGSGSHCARDGHRFESPQLHHEVRASESGFRLPGVPRGFNGLARAMICS